MATVPNTGIRTGGSLNSPSKPPVRRFIDAWKALSKRMRTTIAIGLATVVFGLSAWGAVNVATRPVPLYAAPLSASDVQEMSRRLTELNIPFNLEGGNIVIARETRAHAIGALLAVGLPRRAPAPVASGAGGLGIMGDAERRRVDLDRQQWELVEQLRQFEIVADARVTLVPRSEDALPSETTRPRATALLSLRPGPVPSKDQIRAVLNLVAYSMPDLEADQVKISDTSGHVWNDGVKILSMDSGVDIQDERLALKTAHENLYRTQIATELNKLVGSDFYVLTVGVDLDYEHVKIMETRVGSPHGDNQVVSLTTGEKIKYDNKKPAEGYTKFKFSKQVQGGKIERTAIIEPGGVKRVSATLVVDGHRSPADLETLRHLVGSAIGFDEQRNDRIEVRSFGFLQPVQPVSSVTLSPPPAPLANVLPFAAMAAAIGLVLTGLHLGRARPSSKLQMERAASSGPHTIADLETIPNGRSASAAETRPAQKQTLERLAKERPTKVAELLKSTWLAEKER